MPFEGSDTFVYTLSDGIGGTDTATVTVSITGVNDAPVVVSESYSVLLGQTLFATGVSPTDPTRVDGVLANDSDPENESLSVSLLLSPQFAHWH